MNYSEPIPVEEYRKLKNKGKCKPVSLQQQKAQTRRNLEALATPQSRNGKISLDGKIGFKKIVELDMTRWVYPGGHMVGIQFYCENANNDKPRCEMQCRACRDL